LEDANVDGKIILNRFSGTIMVGVYWIYMAQDGAKWRSGSCEYGNEVSGSIRCGEFLE
jgi:hypothetical protein